MASILFTCELYAQRSGITPDNTSYSLYGLGYDHNVTMADNDADVVSKMIIDRNADAKMVSFDLELCNNYPALYILSWKTETLLVRKGEP